MTEKLRRLLEELQRRIHDASSQTGTCQYYYGRTPHKHCDTKTNIYDGVCDGCLVAEIASNVEE